MWERNWKSQHMQLQVCGVPLEHAGVVRQAFLGHGLKARGDFKWEELDANTRLDKSISKGRPYFHVTLPDGSQLLHCIEGRNFPIQFGREVMCSILGTPDRIEWKACAVDDDAEKEATGVFRKAFKPYDFNLKKTSKKSKSDSKSTAAPEGGGEAKAEDEGTAEGEGEGEGGAPAPEATGGSAETA